MGDGLVELSIQLLLVTRRIIRRPLSGLLLHPLNQIGKVLVPSHCFAGGRNYRLLDKESRQLRANASQLSLLLLQRGGHRFADKTGLIPLHLERFHVAAGGVDRRSHPCKFTLSCGDPLACTNLSRQRGCQLRVNFRYALPSASSLHIPFLDQPVKNLDRCFRLTGRGKRLAMLAKGRFDPCASLIKFGMLTADARDVARCSGSVCMGARHRRSVRFEHRGQLDHSSSRFTVPPRRYGTEILRGVGAKTQGKSPPGCVNVCARHTGIRRSMICGVDPHLEGRESTPDMRGSRYQS